MDLKSGKSRFFDDKNKGFRLQDYQQNLEKVQNLTFSDGRTQKIIPARDPNSSVLNPAGFSVELFLELSNEFSVELSDEVYVEISVDFSVELTIEPYV